MTGIAFVSANLGAVEIMGMSANGAQYGMPTFHYFWIGAVPAMIFLGLVMMPFYYGSKVRSVPEFMLKRYGTAAHLVNALSFALAQLLIAGINLYLLGKIMNWLLGWPLWVGLIVAAVIVFSYITMGGLSAAIYNEVLQFFVIVAALLPLTLIGLHRVGGWHGLTSKITEAATAAHPNDATEAAKVAAQQLHSWPGNSISGFDSNLLSVIGLVFGLGFVLSFGYWTTNFVEVQRAMASDSISSAQSTPIIGTFVKMFVPFLVIVPGMVAGVMVSEIQQLKADSGAGYQFNDAVLYLMRDLLPNGLLGLAITGLLASFMAGMAANISAFNTVWGVDIYQHYLKKDADDAHYLMVGKLSTLTASVVAILTAIIASSYSTTSWTTSRRCSRCSTRRCSRPSSSGCSGSGPPRTPVGSASSAEPWAPWGSTSSSGPSAWSCQDRAVPSWRRAWPSPSTSSSRCWSPWPRSRSPTPSSRASSTP
ncbi:sodium:solute symporter family transporter [Actinomyces oris]|uniref:sodium:solute symporter family transporter n=1 Tax=Actinomyces oris TaxID=544580 RepID=UPI000A6B3924|nr:hypothetical protein [Actinomyces oris]